MCRDPSEPLWSVQRSAPGRFRVMWGLFEHDETD